MSGVTLAHVGAPLAPHDLATAWSAEPLVLMGVWLVAAAYRRGLKALWASAGRGQVVAVGQARAFSVGLALLLVALVSPLGALGTALAAGHMVQHLVLSLLAAPLLVLGAPGAALSRALPPQRRQQAVRWQGRLRRLARRWPWLPGAGLGAFTLVWWLWHIPALYNAALRSPAVHAAEHATMLAAALALWAPVLRPRRTPVWAGPLLLLGATVQGGMLAALLTFAPRALYAYGAASAAWGLTPLEDQALAGVIMWVPGGVVYLAAAAVLFARWLDRDARESSRTVAHVS